jgi:NAD(P)-dependent dehydrogenase (short-subunit alcohol dehydrogenase family)
MIDLAGKVAFITGAASGIGRETALYMAERGAKVVVTDVNEVALTDIANEIGPDNALPLKLDVTCYTQWQDCLKRSVSHFGALHILVNNAGIFLQGSFENSSYDDFLKISKVNVMGTFHGVKAAIDTFRSLSATGQVAQGAIVNIASLAALAALKDMPSYCASKAAVRNMTRAIAVECGCLGEQIRINSVNPGTVRSNMTEPVFGSEFFDDFSAETLPIPMADYCTPRDIAAAVAFLASDQAAVITGAEITVDGAWSTGLAGLNL